MSTRTVASYPEVVIELKRLGQEHLVQGDTERWEAAEQAARDLSRWIEAGCLPPCPVDLAPFDVGVSRPTPESNGELVLRDTTIADAVALPQGALKDSGPEPLVEEADALEALPEPETPEALGLRRQLDLARADLEAGEWTRALRLARMVSDHAADNQRLKASAQDLEDRAQRSLDAEMARLLSAGQQARLEQRIDQARDFFGRANQLDPDNPEVRMALTEIGQQIAKATAQDFSSLRLDLKNRKTLTVLEAAINRAKALTIDNRLDAESLAALKEAEEAYEQIRMAQGAVTTRMRLGDLEERRKARDDINERVSRGELEIFDPTINQIRPSDEVLREANRLFDTHSADTADYELARVARLLPAHPALAHQRIEEALQKPFSEHHRRKLELQLLEVDRLNLSKTRAEQLLAERGDDALVALGRLLEAESIFPHLDGLSEQLAQAHRAASEQMVNTLASLRKEAEANLIVGDFSQARATLRQALTLATRWPEENKPEAVLRELQDCREVGDRVDARDLLQREFEARANAIRSKVVDPDQRRSGLDLLETLRADERFRDLVGRDALILELGAYRSANEQLAEARVERTRGNWRRVLEIADSLQKAGGLGSVVAEVDSLYAEATTEQAIAEAQRLLEAEEVAEANKIISTLLARKAAKGRRDDLRERLKKETSRIQSCIDRSPPMRTLYIQAEELARKSAVSDRLAALTLYRYVGGDPLTAAGEGWPPYQLSLVTTAARGKARELGKQLRDEFLPGLRAAFDRNTDRSITPTALAVLADQARAIRQAGLIDSEATRLAIRWAEVEHALRVAAALRELGDTAKAIALLLEVDQNHPLAVDRELRELQVMHTVVQAREALRHGDSEGAVQILQTARLRPSLHSAWAISLALAEAHTAQGNFVQARSDVADAEQWEAPPEAVAAQRADIRREEIITRALTRADGELAHQADKDALRILSEALHDPHTTESRRLKTRIQDLFQRNESEVLARVRLAQTRGSADVNVQAIIGLVDLQEMEEIVAIPPGERKSVSALESLRAGLSTAADAIVREAQNLEPEKIALDQALALTHDLGNRLQVFARITPLFQTELADVQERLENTRSKIVADHERLQRIKDLLVACEPPELWERALVRGNFDGLTQSVYQIQQQNIVGLLEVQRLVQRLAEWKDMHTIFHERLTGIKRLFQIDEDFDRVVEELRGLNARPDARPGGQPWRIIQQADYARIREVMSGQLHVVDIFSDNEENLTGFAQVEQTARSRAADLALWRAWDQTCRRRMDVIVNAMTVTEHHEGEALRTQRSNWEAVRSAALAALELLDQEAQQDGQPVPVQSRQAKGYQAEGRQRREIAQSVLSDAEQRIAQVPSTPFPSNQEFAEAARQNDPDRLERLIRQGERVGASTPDEEKRLRAYRLALQDLRRPKKGRWF